MSLTVTDLFCGAGGSSIGAEVAGATLRLGLNHWQRAIETHAQNFPRADHDCEDVSSLTTAQIRRYPDSDILLASPECTNHSLAKGARRRKPQSGSLFEDGPAGDDEQDRSRATMWDVVRFAEQKELKGKPYKAIIVENVVDAFNWGPGDDGALFDAWLTAMDGLGYRHEIVWLNSMFAGAVPQSRDRMYVVYWRKGIKAPDLRFSPASWCPACERIVEGRQAFKRQRRGRNWGRYGPQYLFKCPGCAGTVFPGAPPAETILDWGLPAPLIGERERPLAANSRERIRRGLAKILSEPFAIRLSHGGNPRPLTLPLVTLTARHDLTMVTPVAGNTYERTPGNRARRTDARPLGGAEEPIHPVLTGSQQGVVIRNNKARGNPGQMASPTHEPIRALTTRGHQSLLVPYDSSGRGRDPELEPATTLTSRLLETEAREPEVSDEQIDACGYRMFALHEIGGAMAMLDHPAGGAYVVTGNKREQMAQLGNAVTPPAMRVLLERVLEVLR